VVALAGEIDESTYPGLVSALDEAADGHSEVHFDFAAVEYCDLAGLRAIVCVTGADRPDQAGRRRVVLHRLPPELQTVLLIVGWDCTPGLAVDEPSAAGHASRPGPVVGAVMRAQGGA
jgi:anti-anti-sigma regulatory factor